MNKRNQGVEPSFSLIRVPEPTGKGREKAAQSLTKIRNDLEAALADVSLAKQRQDWNFSCNQHGLTVLEEEAERFKIRLALLIDSERSKDDEDN